MLQTRRSKTLGYALFLSAIACWAVVAWRSGGPDPLQHETAAAPGRQTVEEGLSPAPPRGARQPATHTARHSSRRDQVTGTVASESGAPIIGADVILFSSAEGVEGTLDLGRAITDARGGFILEGAGRSPGLHLVASAKGYRDAVVPVASEGDTAIVLEPKNTSVTVTGRVVDAKTSGWIPSFEVKELGLAEDEDGLTVVERWKPVQQSSRGFSIQLETLGSEELQLVVRARGYASADRDLAIDGTSVDAGEIALRPGNGIWGSVLSHDGTPIGKAGVLPILAGGAQGEMGWTETGTGSFELLLVQDEELMALFVTADGHAPAFVRSEDVSGAWQGVVVYLSEGARVEGRVTLESGLPAAGAELVAWLHCPDLSQLAGGALGSGCWSRAARTDARGEYSFEGVPEGIVEVGVVHDENVERTTLGPIRSVAIEERATHRLDFDLAGSCELRGRIEMTALASTDGDDTVFIELFPGGDAPQAPLAAVEALVGHPFVLRGVDVPTGTRAVLRISLAPGFFAERKVSVEGAVTDLGTFDFPSAKALAEFNRPGRALFETR